MSLTQEQVNLLLQPLDDWRVRSLSGNNHLEAWDVRRWLLRIFGWGGWDFTVKSCDVVSERNVWDEKNPLKGRHTVVYRVIGVLTIKDATGQVVAVYEDGAVGDGINQPSLQAAHDFALKTAMSQALKRCAVNLGDTFGLSLYSKGSTKAVVGRSVAHKGSATYDADEAVQHGEMDEPVEAKTELETSTAPAVADQLPPAPSPEAGGSAPDETLDAVHDLREKVLAAMTMTRQDALVTLARLNAEAGKDRLLGQMTTSPAGEPMTVSVFIDRAIKSSTGKRP